MIRTSSVESPHSFSANSQMGWRDTAFLGGPVLHSNPEINSTRSGGFHPEGMQRLSIAIINRAVHDLLEN